MVVELSKWDFMRVREWWVGVSLGYGRRGGLVMRLLLTLIGCSEIYFWRDG